MSEHLKDLGSNLPLRQVAGRLAPCAGMLALAYLWWRLSDRTVNLVSYRLEIAELPSSIMLWVAPSAFLIAWLALRPVRDNANVSLARFPTGRRAWDEPMARLT